MLREPDDDQEVSGGQSGPTRATKKGGRPVIISVRKVQGKNVTFIDGLDEWGFSKEMMSDLAKELRRRFSASVVQPRRREVYRVVLLISGQLGERDVRNNVRWARDAQRIEQLRDHKWGDVSVNRRRGRVGEGEGGRARWRWIDGVGSRDCKGSGLRSLGAWLFAGFG